MNDATDRLVDALLREGVGNERLPDLTGKILARARARRIRRLVLTFGALAAACVVLAFAVRLMLYPAPKAEGEFRVVGGGKIARGAVIETGTGSARLDLGGYCHVELQPESLVKIEGAAKSEQVMLQHGAVLCEVDHPKGSFTVRTELGTVRANGTKFAVELIELKGQGSQAMIGQRMLVRVLAGTVLASGSWGARPLHAGEATTLPPVKQVADNDNVAPRVTQIYGTLTKIDADKNALAIVTAADGNVPAKTIVITVTDRTKILHAGNMKGPPAAFKDLKVGQHLTAAFNGDMTAVNIYIQADKEEAPRGGDNGGAPGGGQDGNTAVKEGNGNVTPILGNKDWGQQRLGVTDEEWTVLLPKVAKVRDLSSKLLGEGWGNSGRTGVSMLDQTGRVTTAPPALFKDAPWDAAQMDNADHNPAEPPKVANDVGDKMKTLFDATLNNNSAPRDFVKALADLRAAREKVKAELVAAQKDLKELVTSRQEAELVLMGILD